MALVARLVTVVEEHSVAVGLRKYKRNSTGGKLDYFRANSLGLLTSWIFRSGALRTVDDTALTRSSL
ncbi:hypothetical protein ACVWXM_006243 [Bradyrhizobium sp. GM7.3]